jgi:hypothetical protein
MSSMPTLNTLKLHSKARLRTLNLFAIRGSAHSPAAGTTIDLIITGLSAGAGLVAAEFLKGAGKDLWKAFKRLLPGAAKEASSDERSISELLTKSERRGAVGDTISITLVIDGRKVSTSITVPAQDSTITHAELVKSFCENAAVGLYLRELERIKREAPLTDRLRAHKDSKPKR